MINYDIYGIPSTWAYYGNNISDIKVACFDENSDAKYSLLAGIQSGKLSYDSSIDKSISFCGIGKECPFSNLVYYHGENGTISSEVKTALVTNYFLNTIPSVYSSYWDISAAYTMYDDSNTFNIGVWSKGGENRRNANNWVQPIADFKPQNIVLCIYVDCKQTQNDVVTTVTLSDYINNNMYLQFPYVERVIGDIRVGNYTAGGTNTRTTPLLTADFIMSVSTLEPFESTYINKCYRYNSFQATNESYLPLLFSALRTTNYAYNDIICFGDFTSDNNFEITQDNNNVWRMSYHVTAQNASEFKEMCLSSAAQYGLYFTDNTNTAFNGEFTDENMYIGILDNEGITHGEYLKGKRTAESAQAKWDSIRESPYDYKTADNTNYVNNTLFYPQMTTGAFTKSYVLSKTQVDALAQEAYNAVSQAPSDDDIENYNQRYFLTSNVIDCIISLKKFPCVPNGLGVQVPLKIGAYTTQLTGFPLIYTVKQIDFVFSRSDNNTLYPIYDDFRDYEPYTKCSISIPFCGNVEIPCAYAYRYDIKISLLVDLITGACTAFVICNGDVIETTSGNCAIDLPLSGLQSATLDSQMYSASTAKDKNKSALGLGIVGGAIAIGVGIATGGVAAAVGGAAAVIGSFINASNTGKAINYEMSHMQAPFKTISAASGNISQAYDMRCKMLIKRPVIGDYDSEIYAETIGHACLKNTKVGAISGFTVGDINLDSIDRTAEEKEMIRSAFATGVYL